MKVGAVRDAYLARIKEFQESLFQPAKIAKLVDQVAGLIRPVVEQEGDDMLKRFDQAVAGKTAEPAEGGPGMRFGMGNGKPVMVFARERYQSVADQLAGKSEGIPLGGGPGGGRGPGGRGGGMRNFGPGNLLGPAVVKAADADQNGAVTAQEFTALANRWFSEWDKEKTGELKQAEVAAGLNALIPPPNFGGPPPP
ncbi:MAG TPA: hypothetical protein DCE44_14335 [Verrucomicrobiales bacterium]|nr:hypothetical protein [Verrucomicrobiales bacterium]